MSDKRELYLNAKFIEVAKDNPTNPCEYGYCFDIETNRAITAESAVHADYYHLFISSPVMFQTLEMIAVRLSKLSEELLLKGIDASDEIDYLINSTIQAQNIALNGLIEEAARNMKEQRLK
ncbi:hypothetical protein [Acinetobacter phage vB_AbaSi_W9]|nr:hypothetical protein [Acinetobacter phage vB_AbaSi_W9]